MTHTVKASDGRLIQHPGRKTDCGRCRPRPLKTSTPAARLAADAARGRRGRKPRQCERCLAELGPDNKGRHCTDQAACEARQPGLFSLG